MKRYDEKPTKRCARALQCYIILIGYAQRRHVLTYGELGRLIGYNKHVSVIGCNALGPIMSYCEREGLPALTSIVVNEQTGKPGLGFNSRGRRPLSYRMPPSTTTGTPTARRRNPSYRRAPAANI